MSVLEVRRRIAWLVATMLLATCLMAAAQPPPPRVKLVDLLRALIATGVDVLYSSELVPPSLDAPDLLPESDPMSRLVAALAVNRLELRITDQRHYVVTRAVIPSAPAGAVASTDSRSPPRDAPLAELSVFASRYQYTTNMASEPIEFDGRQIEQVPGAQEDVMRALRTAPGLATNLSVRPYVRGALLDDVLVEFDGIPLADPFHFKSFQSVNSVFDPSTVERADVFTGGFPVKFGTRSGGVIDLAPRSVDSGYEIGIGASLLSYDFGTVGRAERWPIEWLISARLSGDHSVLLPLQGDYGEPKFSDLIGRLRWNISSTLAVTLGLLALDDQVSLASDSAQELATDRSHDLDAWLRWDWTPTANVQSHTSFAVESTERNDSGNLLLPNIAVGSLYTERSFSNIGLRSELTYASSPAVTWDYGAEISRESADLEFSRRETLAQPIALSFGEPSDATLNSRQEPRYSTLGLFASAHRHWQTFEAEIGLRLDGQTYQGFGTRGQLSPRTNLRYDLTDSWHAYGSWGQFTQAQRVDEYRSEENQVTPDSANRATHLIAGIAHDSSDAVHWRFEAYRNYWSTISPYFDNLLGSVSLLPELQPGRVLIAPRHAEAVGIELSAQRSFDHGLSAWALYSLAKVTDELAGQDIPRSWDQPHAANAGIAWTHSRSSVSALLGWHSGWPLTPVTVVPATSTAPALLVVGARDSGRWGSYFSLGLRLSTSVPLRYGELSLWVDAINVTNQSNDCCVDLISMNSSTGAPAMVDKIWSPRIINMGFSWRLRATITSR